MQVVVDFKLDEVLLGPRDGHRGREQVLGFRFGDHGTVVCC